MVARLSTTVATANPVDLGSSAFRPSLFAFRADRPPANRSQRPAAILGLSARIFELDQELPENATQANKDNYLSQCGPKLKKLESIVAELPLGLVGDPQATPRCSQRQFSEPAPGIGIGSNLSALAQLIHGRRRLSDSTRLQQRLPDLDLVPETGHAAEFGFHSRSVPIVLFGGVVKGTRGYVLRIDRFGASSKPSRRVADLLR